MFAALLGVRSKPPLNAWVPLVQCRGASSSSCLERDLFSQVERIEGYQQFIESKSLKCHLLELPYELNYEEITNKITQFLLANEELDSVFFSTNFLTLGGLKAINKLGGKYTQMGLVSFDDHLLYDVLTPAITAVKQPVKQIASSIINHLLEMLNAPADTAIEPQTIVFPVELMVRQSSLKR